MLPQFLFSSKSDWAGIFSASLCVVHCLLTPLLMVLTATFSWWAGLSYVFLFISFYAAFDTSRAHTPRPILLLIWGGFVLLTLSIILEDAFPVLHKFSYPASLLLVIGHILNLRHCKKCGTHE
ncbi:MerC domain-containing protein [Arundinibacter roseus]|uniref:MerC domain-containing protein n=1 Tax=Arundinibacter roseus TaxID=2070510 RepID=A0A4R4KBW4_9BACT|nr:MerC domain-containing protein [Arundinibacter roseus]TDB63709.1 MerC domain-containing protein [Arundinibacter roseus]